MTALRLLPLAALSALAGCDDPCKTGYERQKDGECYPAASVDTGFGIDTASPFDSGGFPDTGDAGSPLPQLSVSWTGSGVTLSILNGQGRYSFGMAETGSSCGNGAGDCWTGEDCVYGFMLGDGTLLQYCHEASETGVVLAYGGNPVNLNEGSETIFPNSDFEGSVTYYLEDSSGACFTWGHNPDYYAAEGCTPL